MNSNVVLEDALTILTSAMANKTAKMAVMKSYLAVSYEYIYTYTSREATHLYHYYLLPLF